MSLTVCKFRLSIGSELDFQDKLETDDDDLTPKADSDGAKGVSICLCFTASAAERKIDTFLSFFSLNDGPEPWQWLCKCYSPVRCEY